MCVVGWWLKVVDIYLWFCRYGSKLSYRVLFFDKKRFFFYSKVFSTCDVLLGIVPYTSFLGPIFPDVILLETL